MTNCFGELVYKISFGLSLIWCLIIFLVVVEGVVLIDIKVKSLSDVCLRESREHQLTQSVSVLLLGLQQLPIHFVIINGFVHFS
jgi:hypothetical protein